MLFCLALTAACSRSDPESGPMEKTSGESVTVEVNSRAPAFAAQTLDGGTVRLADSIGSNVVLLEFWSIFCKSCVEEMPHVEDLYRRYAAEGLTVVSVNTDVFSAKRVTSFLQKVGIRPPYPIVRDARQEIVEAYKVEVLPVTVLIDRSGWIRLYQEGYRPGDEDQFESKIRRLLGREGDEDVTLASRGGVTVFAPAGASLAAQGQAVSALRSRNANGEDVALATGRPSLLVFWSLFCKPCRDEFPQVAALAERYRTKGLVTYSVNVDSDRLRPRVDRFSGKHPELPCLLDGTEAEGKGSLAKALGVRATPTHVLLDGQGKVLHATAGKTDLPALEAKIQAAVGR
ncbi:MAG: TlpA family protein disulfide reductase [Deltaproteobacteria bacterium]|nr:TlpA family protein disulfide reductase [Deltaproteobacteria bacterium]